MRRFFIGCAAAALLLAGGALASSAVAQATTAPAAPAAVHPVVGAWQLTVAEFPDDPPSLVAFHADGTYQESDADGTVGIGSWEATGPSSVNLTFMSYVPSDDEARPDADDSCHGRGERGRPDLHRPVHDRVHRRRLPHRPIRPRPRDRHAINVEPMGTPVGSLDDLFAQFGGPPGTAGTESVATAPAGTEPVGTPPAGTEPAGTSRRERRRAPSRWAPAGEPPDGHRTGHHPGCGTTAA